MNRLSIFMKTELDTFDSFPVTPENDKSQAPGNLTLMRHSPSVYLRLPDKVKALRPIIERGGNEQLERRRARHNEA